MAPDSEYVETVVRRLSEATDVCVDVETSGLDWRTNFICGYVFTFSNDPRDSYYLPFRHRGGGNIPGCAIPKTPTDWNGKTHKVEKQIIKLLDRQDKRIFGHHIHFDLKFLNRVGMTKFDPRIECTQLNAGLINELQPKFSLDECTKLAGVAQKRVTIYDYIKANVPEAAASAKTGKDMMEFYWMLAGDDPEAFGYACDDGTATWQLRDIQNAHIAGQDLTKVWDVESRLIPVLARMMVRGIKIDEEQLDWVIGEATKRRDAAAQTLPENFNSRSPTDMRNYMESVGRTDWPMTEPSKTFPNGQPSFRDKWLQSFPEGQAIVAVRRYNNLLNTFLMPMKERHLFHGRVHPEYHQLRGDEFGTITGRLSSSNPNLHAVHKRNKELAALLRSIYIPDDGCIWSSNDYSQCEPRLLAYYSRCRVLLEGYRADPPIDAHSAVAKAAGIDREDGKRLNQALITGSGYKAAAEQMGKPFDEAEPIIDAYFEAMPEIKQIQKRASGVMASRGYVLSLLGRRARLEPSINGRSFAYKALNRLLQCGNADILKVKMVELDDYYRSEGEPVQVLNNCHDALEKQRELSDKGKRVLAEGIKIMTSFGDDDLITLDVPMMVDSGEGVNWSLATFGDKGGLRRFGA